jgi:hypothetical protein
MLDGEQLVLRTADVPPDRVTADGQAKLLPVGVGDRVADRVPIIQMKGPTDQSSFPSGALSARVVFVMNPP